MEIVYLEKKAKEIRRETFEMVMNAGRGHLGGSLSIVEILVALYYGGILRFNPHDPKWEGRDTFLLSKGHTSSSLFVVLADLGFFPKTELNIFSKAGSILSQHCDANVPGVEFTAGSLGHGLGIGSGIAFGNRLDGKQNLVFVVMGDGECQEGSVWEAAMFAGHHRLGNLIAIVDRNKLGSEDFTERTCRLEPMPEKWSSFGWEVKTIDGHSFSDILAACEGCRSLERTRPLMIISRTVKGKGLSCLENLPRSHNTLPKGDEIMKSRSELS